MKIINCLETQQNIISYIEEHDPKRVLLLFLHGLGDFLGLLDYEKYDLIDRSKEIVGDYDFVFGIQYTQNQEGAMCKAENCMLEEVGSFDPLTKPHQKIPVMRPRLVTVHFFSTWGPSAFGMVGREETAHKIWSEIIKAGLIPMETHFEHKYSNPENQNFEWMNAQEKKLWP